jgi:hypothetical protein
LALKAFPPVQHAFAYGSGVFRQPGSETLRGAGEGAPLVDLIFAVRSAARHAGTPALAHVARVRWTTR